EQLTRQKRGAQFDLSVNPQTDPETMPVEDPTIEWTSAPVRLATISIYPQKCDGPEQMAFVENLSWNPWNALPEHLPLGGINRARKLVYMDSSDLRHKTTGQSPVVPTGRESF
ncbi:MAG: catalase, partial [Vicinamibacterales bacterium]